MMKKKNLKIYVLSFVLLTAFSCGDNFADTESFGVLSEEQLANPLGVDLLLTSAYAIVDGVRATGEANPFAVSPDNWWFDVIADDAHKGSNNADQLDLQLLENIQIFPSNSFVRAKFQALYAGVARANAVLIAIADLQASDADAPALTSEAAQARFLRGYFYFELTKIFGNVAIIDEVQAATGDFNVPNTGPAYDLIEADFQFAMENLPAARIPGEEARPTAGVARAFLGKTLLYQQDYAGALAQFTTVINSGEFSLQPDFINNFTLVGENGSEALFQAQYDASGVNSPNGNRGGTLNFPGGDPFGSCCGFYQPSIDLANAYLVDGTTGLPNNLDGELILANDYNIESDEAFTPDTTSPVDVRLDYTVGRRGIDYNGYGPNPGLAWVRAIPDNGDFSGPYLPKKNVYQSAEEGGARGRGVWGQEHSGLNYNIMRYADVLLMAAEAAVETGDLATALGLVNQVRERAANSTQVQDAAGGSAANYMVGLYTSFPDAAFAQQAVRMERRLELGMEGHRFFDLVRWGIAPQAINDYIAREARVIGANITNNFTTDFQEFNGIMPIPTASVGISNNALLQNPGY